MGEGDKKRAKVEQPQEETEEKSKPSEDEIGYWGEEDDAFLAAMIQQEEEREQKEREKAKGNGMGKEKEKGGEAKGEFVLEERKGDLFSAGDGYCLAHCVSEDLAMGKGVAKPFKEKFGGVNELRAQKPKTGGVCVLKRENRWIYYLITKVSLLS